MFLARKLKRAAKCTNAHSARRVSGDPLPGDAMSNLFTLLRSIGPLQIDDWVEKVDVSGYDLRCYFCGQINGDWHQRARHIIYHVDKGEKVTKWKIARDFRCFPPASKTPRPFPLSEISEYPAEGKYCRHIIWDEGNGGLKPPSIYASLLRPVDEPPNDDTSPFVLVKQAKFYEEGNLYHPSWIRTHGGEDWWCGMCRPGRWISGSHRASWDKHIMFTHGISLAMLPFPGPLEVQPKDGHCRTWEGLCMSCSNWIELTFDEEDEMNWFRHAARVRLS
ncbi:hypothetical protein F4782DRAFT_544164 [Xylaria castorea]|nr:hypothetical protein F4782DRAFT_544164 [Xylaria castorea]